MQAQNPGAIQERVRILQNVSIFSQTEEKILTNIAEALNEVTTEAMENVFMKGDEGRSMYIILSGKVKVHDGDYNFAELSTGQVFGEYALLDTEQRSASVTTLTPTTLLVLDQVTFYDILVNHVQILRGILQVLVGRARLNNRLQEELAREKKRIEQQNDEIKVRNEEILAQNEEIIQQQAQIETQNTLLQEKNALITSSINYAKHIQNALLPDITDFKALFPDSFILFQPKDIVSGDFYWFYQLPDAPEKIIVVCADCTGHGVPGAFMSFLGMTYFKQIIEFQEVRSIDEILYQLNQNIYIALKQESLNNKDGMDLAICLIDREKRLIDFAGAKTNLMYIEIGKDADLQIIKGDNSSIGGYFVQKKFTRHRFNFQPNTVFYLTSDGYRDQFGYKNDQKFMNKRFKQLLLDIHKKPMSEQKSMLFQAHHTWRGHFVQTDDILVMGFKL
jgi:CRP-like cAMP-binding protein